MRASRSVVCLLLLVACGEAPPWCPEGTRLERRSRLGGVERLCERADASRHGPYRFESSDLRVHGEYVDGQQHGSWDWMPAGGPTRNLKYRQGAVEDELGYLTGLRHGHWIEYSTGGIPDSYWTYCGPTVSSQTPTMMYEFCKALGYAFLERRGPKARETEYECGKVVQKQGWYPNGAPIPADQIPRDHPVPQEAYDACMVKWRAYQEKLKHGEISPLPVLP